MGRPPSPSCRRVYYRGTSNFEQSLDARLRATCPPLPIPFRWPCLWSARMARTARHLSRHELVELPGPRTWPTSAPCVCVRHRGAPAAAASPFSLALVPLIALRSGLHCRKWWRPPRSPRSSARGTPHAGLPRTSRCSTTCARPSTGCVRIATTLPTPPPRPRPRLRRLLPGAHVAVSLLQQPARLVASGLPWPCEGLCDGILLLSGVLGSRLGARPSPAILAVCFGLQALALPSPVDQSATLVAAAPTDRL